MMFRSPTALALGVVCLSTTGHVSAQEAVATANTPTFPTRVVTSDLNFPWDGIWGPDDHLWVTERVGKRILRVNPHLELSSLVFCDFFVSVVVVP